MANLRFVFILIFPLVLSLPTNGQRKAVFVIVDGIPADVLERVETPVMDEISSLGGYTRSYVGGEKGGYNESPTISSPGYNHVLTGVWTHKHNVWDNDIRAPNYHYWNIFRIAEKARPDIKTAIFSSWTDNRTKLVGEGLAEAGGITLDYAYDGLELDTVRFPHTEDRKFMSDIDRSVSEEAARYILEQGPDLSWVYLEFTDDMGHMHGDGPRFYDAVRNADQHVGNIWRSIRERESKFDEQWMIVITTDHGRDTETGRNHGGQTERERTTWIVTNLADLNDHFGQSPAVVDIMPSILRFMRIPVPENIAGELDGIPFTGKVSVAGLRAQRKGKTVELTWNTLDPEGKLEVLVATSNEFNKGKTDNYVSAGKTDVAAGRYSFVSGRGDGFLKILVKAPHNQTGVWLPAKRQDRK